MQKGSRLRKPPTHCTALNPQPLAAPLEPSRALMGKKRMPNEPTQQLWVFQASGDLNPGAGSPQHPSCPTLTDLAACPISQGRMHLLWGRQTAQGHSRSYRPLPRRMSQCERWRRYHFHICLFGFSGWAKPCVNPQLMHGSDTEHIFGGRSP